MSKLKSLAKLRQFSKGQDVGEYLSTEYRQNLLAIEQSINSMNNSTGIYMTFGLTTVAPSTEKQIVFSSDFKIDTYGIESSNVFTANQDQSFNLIFNFQNLSISGGQAVYLKVYVGTTAVKTFSLFSTSSTSSFVVPASIEFPISLQAGNKLYFAISVSTGPNSVTIDSGILKMSKLNI